MLLYEIWTDEGSYIGSAYGLSHDDAIIRYLRNHSRVKPDSIHARLSPKN